MVEKMNYTVSAPLMSVSHHAFLSCVQLMSLNAFLLQFYLKNKALLIFTA